MFEFGEPLAAALRVSEDLADRAAVLALQAGKSLQPLLNVVKPGRESLLVQCVVAQLSAQVLSLVHQGLQAFRQRLERWVESRAGLEFAFLTGDFNPVHWVRRYARAAGFASPILHGFAMMARTMESLGRTLGPVWGNASLERLGDATPYMSAAAILVGTLLVAVGLRVGDRPVPQET